MGNLKPAGHKLRTVRQAVDRVLVPELGVVRADELAAFSWLFHACSTDMPGGHIRLRMLIFPALRAPSQLIALSRAKTLLYRG